MSESISRVAPNPPTPDPAGPTAAAGPAKPGAFKEALESFGGEVDQGERLVRRALGAGGGLGAGDLIALQAGIYRYSEAVDLAGKLVDRAGQAVKSTLQSGGS